MKKAWYLDEDVLLVGAVEGNSFFPEDGGEHADIIGCFLHIKMETRNFEQLKEIRQALAAAGYQLLN